MAETVNEKTISKTTRYVLSPVLVPFVGRIGQVTVVTIKKTIVTLNKVSNVGSTEKNKENCDKNKEASHINKSVDST